MTTETTAAPVATPAAKPAKASKAKKPAPKAKPAPKGKAKAAKAKPAKEKKERGMSQIDAAAKVLATCKAGLGVKEMVEKMEAKGLWKSPGGKTPAATLYSAIIREIGNKGKDSRFKKLDRGLFAAK
jgi:hypothetical protein